MNIPALVALAVAALAAAEFCARYDRKVVLMTAMITGFMAVIGMFGVVFT